MTVPSTDPRYLELFPAWLGALGTDAAALGVVVSGDAPEPVRRYVVAGLNYLFKSLDLIPDGIDDLGFLDDAFVLRVAASLALAESPQAAGPGDGEVLRRLATDAKAVKDAGVRGTFTSEVSGWSKSFECPSFTRDAKTLIKLKAFLSAKLP